MDGETRSIHERADESGGEPAWVLFLCTGNYYRSRFAEQLFNHRARMARLAWRAESRGLATELLLPDIGPIAQYAVTALEARGVGAIDDTRWPQQATFEDLARAKLVVALKEAEHRPLIEQRLPGWEDRVTYWHVDDVDAMTPTEATAEIALQVEELVETLKAMGARG